MTPFPLIPNRNAPNFSDAMDSYMSLQNPFIAELNDTVALLSPLAASASAIVATANYKGLWSSLSGALAIPASVYHLGKFWTLTTSLANVSLKVPGTDAEWVSNSDNNGANITSPSANVTLTATDKRLQVISPTVANLSVTLPATSTVVAGSEFFLMKNTGDFSFNVLDSAGVFLVQIQPSQFAYFSCSSTGGGTWVVGNLSTNGALGMVKKGTETVLNGAPITALTNHQVFMLTDTVGVVTWASTSTVMCAVLTISGAGVPSIGTPVQVDNTLSGVISSSSICKISDTRVAFFYAFFSGVGQSKAVIIDISGTVPTLGALFVMSANQSHNGCQYAALTATTMVGGFQDNTGSYFSVLTITGSTITQGTPVGSNYPTSIVAVDSTTAIGFRSDNNLFRVTVSGTVPTQASALALAVGFRPSGNDVVLVGATKCAVLSPSQAPATDSRRFFITIYDFTTGSFVRVRSYPCGAGVAPTVMKFDKVSNTRFNVFTIDTITSSNELELFDITDNGIFSLGATKMATDAPSSYIRCSQGQTTRRRFVTVHINTSSYLTATVLDIAK